MDPANSRVIQPGQPATQHSDVPADVPFWRDPCLWMLVGIALLLRLVRLGFYDFWHDEVHNLLCAEFLGDLLRYGHLASNHPPLPYILLRGWLELGFGPDEFSLRLLPALAGTAGVVSLYLFARYLFDRSTACWTAALLAVSPFHILHSQDLKEYIYLPTLAPLIGYFMLRAVGEKKVWWWVLYGLAAGLGCYTEAFVVPLLVALNLWAIAKMYAERAHGRVWGGWVGGNVLGAALFVPWLTIMLRKAVATMVESKEWWVPTPALLEVIIYLKTIAYGYSVFWWATGAAVLVFYALVLWGVYNGWRMGKVWETGLVVCWFIIPVGIVFAISHVTESVFLMRAMLPYAVGMYMLAGMGLRHVSFRPAVLLVLAGTLSCGLGQYYIRDLPARQYPFRPGIHPPQPFRQGAAYIAEHWQEGDLVLHASHANWLPFLWYGLRGRPMKNAGAMAGFIRYFELANPRNTPNPIMDGYFPEPIESQVIGFQRIWFVYGEWERESLGDHALIAWRWMDGHYTEVDRAAFGDLDIRLYEPREKRPVHRRIRDNGLAAEEVIRPEAISRIKVLPDASLMGSPPPLPAMVTADGSPLGLLLELDPASRQARLISRRETPVRCRIEWAYSWTCVEAAGLTREDIRRDTWLPVARYNPAPPPQTWMTTMLSGNLQHGDGSASTTVALPAGAYRLWVNLTGPVPSEQYLLAPVTISAGNTGRISLGCSSSGLQQQDADEMAVSPETPAWRWYEGSRPFTTEGQDPVMIQVTAQPLSGPEPGWVNLGDLLIVPDACAECRVQQQDVTLEPGEEMLIPEGGVDPVLKAQSRFDVWVWPADDTNLALRVFADGI